MTHFLSSETAERKPPLLTGHNSSEEITALKTQNGLDGSRPKIGERDLKHDEIEYRPYFQKGLHVYKLCHVPYI